MLILGIGTDIIECSRIGRMIQRHGEYFLQRVYTPVEIAYCQAHRAYVERFAGRWAAKEAILKSLGTGWRRGICWQDVEILNAATGKPMVKLTGGAREHAEHAGIDEILLSLSHCRTHATAYALAVSYPDS